MGNNINSPKKSNKLCPKSKIINKVECPFCLKVIGDEDKVTYIELDNHIHACKEEQIQLFKEVEKEHSKSLTSPMFVKYDKSILIKCKYPFNNTSNNATNNDFNTQFDILRSKVNKLKKNWENGSCFINIDRNRIIKDSINEFKNIDIYKELKINFKGEISNDAGGIIREWFNVLFEELCRPENSK